MKAKNKSAYHWVILVCCILTLMFAYSTRVSLAQLFSTEILKETGFSTGAYFLTSMITSILCTLHLLTSVKASRKIYENSFYRMLYRNNGNIYVLWFMS